MMGGQHMTSPPAPSAVPDRLAAALLGSKQEEGRPDLGGQPVVITYAEEMDDGRTLSISPEVVSVLGYTQAEWMADPMLWVRLMHPEDRDRVIQACAAANRARRTFRAEYRMIARDGRTVWIRDEASVIFGSRGHPLCWQGVMVVVSEQRERDVGSHPLVASEDGATVS